MAERLVKCYGYCEQKYPKSELIKYKNANHCKPCYDKKVKEVEDREHLYNLLKKTFDLNFPTGLMLRQIKEYREQRSYTYKNIAFAVDYIVRIKKIQLQTQYGIAMVPHFYDEMINYYKDLKRRRENMVITENKVQKVYIKPSIPQNKHKERKMIDMEKLLTGGK